MWLAILSILLAFTVYGFLPEDCLGAARRTAFVFVIAAFFWALEIIPIYATSLVIVLLLIFLLAKPDGVLNMDEEGCTVFLVPASNVVIALSLP